MRRVGISQWLSGNGDRHPTSCARSRPNTQYPGASTRFLTATERKPKALPPIWVISGGFAVGGFGDTMDGWYRIAERRGVLIPSAGTGSPIGVEPPTVQV